MTEVNGRMWEEFAETIATMLADSAGFDYEEWKSRFETRLMKYEDLPDHWQNDYNYKEHAAFNMFLTALKGRDPEGNIERGRE